jgi:hypothetical protein
MGTLTVNTIDAKFASTRLVSYGRFYCNNTGDLKTNNSGYINFGKSESSDDDWYSIETTGNFGIKVLRKGILHFMVEQDVRFAAGTDYFEARYYKNSTIQHRSLMSQSTVWDQWTHSGVMMMDVDDIFRIYVERGDLNGMDATPWSQYTFMLFGQE